MPHLITARKREFNQTDKSGLDWEKINAISYILGGVMFVIGSLFFFPYLQKKFPNMGIYLFLIGSFLYLLVVIHDLVEVAAYWQRSKDRFWQKIELIASGIYLLGTILFVVGSVLFSTFYTNVILGDWCFIVGCGLFFVGAGINILQIETEKNLLILQLKNIIAINFLVGSAIFLIACIPYLWIDDRDVILDFSAYLFVVGSLCFLVGGLVSYLKVYLNNDN